MFFLQVYGIPLFLWFSSGFTSESFRWDYDKNMVTTVGLCHSYDLSGLGICVSDFLSVWVLDYDGWLRRGLLGTKGQGGVVVGKSVSHNDSDSALQSTERCQVCADPELMETECPQWLE
jgi:hypothetical protein